MLSLSTALLHTERDDEEARAWLKQQILQAMAINMAFADETQAESAAASIYKAAGLVGLQNCANLIAPVRKSQLAFWIKLCELIAAHPPTDESISAADVEAFLRTELPLLSPHFEWPSFTAQGWTNQTVPAPNQYPYNRYQQPAQPAKTVTPRALRNFRRLATLYMDIGDLASILSLVSRYRPLSSTDVLLSAASLVAWLVDTFSKLRMPIDRAPARQCFQHILEVSARLFFSRLPDGPYDLSLPRVGFTDTHEAPLNTFLADRFKHTASMRANTPSRDGVQTALHSLIRQGRVTAVKVTARSPHMLTVTKRIRSDTPRLPFTGTAAPADITAWQVAKCREPGCRQCATFDALLVAMKTKSSMEALCTAIGGMAAVQRILQDKPDVLESIRTGRPATQRAPLVAATPVPQRPAGRVIDLCTP